MGLLELFLGASVLQGKLACHSKSHLDSDIQHPTESCFHMFSDCIFSNVCTTAGSGSGQGHLEHYPFGL